MAPVFVCSHCGYVGRPVGTIKGSIVLEILMWCLFLLPGIIYTIWRGSTRQKVCPKCKRSSMIPSDTPLGAKLLKEHGQSLPTASQQSGPAPTNWKVLLQVVGILI